jgi:LPS export ABC transporter protein LptC
MRSTELLDCKILNVFIVFGLILICSCKEEKTNEHLGDDPPKITIDEFSLTETDNGRKIYKLDAQHARVYDDVIKVDSVNIVFYDKEEVEFSLLRAPGGILNTKTRNILVGDSVAVFTSDSTKLYTDTLFWKNDSQKIITDCHVTIIKQDGTVIEGRGLRADPYLNKIEILGDAKGLSPIELPDINK